MEKIKRFERPFFITLFILALAMLLFVFRPYLGAIAVAIVLFILFQPLYARFEKMMPRKKGISSFLTVVLALIIILGPVSFFGFKIFQEAEELYMNISQENSGAFTVFIGEKLDQLLPFFDLNLNKYLEQFLGTLVGGVGPIFSKVADTTVKIFLALFAFYYFLKDSDKIKKAFSRASLLSQNSTEKILNKLSAMANSVVKGSLVIALVQGFLLGLGFFIFGLSGPVLWGSVAVIASLIPMLGVGVISVPAVIYLVFSGNLIAAVGFAIWATLIVGLADNFLRPKLIERDINVHPLLIFFSVIGGLAVFGPTGLLLGPLVLSFFLALFEIYPVVLGEK